MDTSRRRFGPMPDQVPIVGQGTWQMAEGRRNTTETTALRAGIAHNLTHIDTAELYGSGAAEDLIAEAIRGIPRRDLFIVSKVLPHNASRAGTLRACAQSLKRLGTDYLDVYLLHWRGNVPLAETLDALEALVDQGKIRALGVSNFDVDDLEEARALLRKHPIVCNQVLYHLGERHIDAELVPYCAARDIAVVGYSPFAHGRFPSPARAAGSVLADVASRHHATPRQVALAFLVRTAPLFTIPKASSVEHAEENAGALGLALSAAEIAEIDAAFPVRAAAELPII
ncbi:MAG TPA: aldo/keto reductase [Polyangia bacterium]|nr:aldo/keto reductase [Polyangia bacterium]